MNVTVDLQNDCPQHWVPDAADMALWINSANQAIDRQSVQGKQMNVSVRVVCEQDSAALNSEYRGKDYPTNVLSFASELPESMSELIDYTPLGDIAICAPIVEAEAQQQGKILVAHWAHLLTHGFLHLSGYEHDEESDAQTMEALEIDVLHRLGFPDPYLIN